MSLKKLKIPCIIENKGYKIFALDKGCKIHVPNKGCKTSCKAKAKAQLSKNLATDRRFFEKMLEISNDITIVRMILKGEIIVIVQIL